MPIQDRGAARLQLRTESIDSLVSTVKSAGLTVVTQGAVAVPVKGVPGQGGSLDGPGPAIGNGMVFVNSGYHVSGGMPDNVLLAFSVDGR